ncbi:hypothetical protein CDAR_236921 [Caerostris darwini]|uniref:Uncharacterized protein n=1 Tax=Caerostris darwini TaxID=1538125 RepID=A0AAV4VZG7_9ARAC|nr:hypothetical protein CDAR_236921 [Caerostris darwini]
MSSIEDNCWKSGVKTLNSKLQGGVGSSKFRKRERRDARLKNFGSNLVNGECLKVTSLSTSISKDLLLFFQSFYFPRDDGNKVLSVFLRWISADISAKVLL